MSPESPSRDLVAYILMLTLHTIGMRGYNYLRLATLLLPSVNLQATATLPYPLTFTHSPSS